MFTTEEKQQLQQKGYSNIGRTPKIAYYTPDGRKIMALPAMRTYADGNGGGLRDANFDKGWLPSMPTELKPYCPSCDLWHDTEEQVDECEQRKTALAIKWQKKAKKELAKEDSGRLDKLETDMGDIKSMLKQLLKEK